MADVYRVVVVEDDPKVLNAICRQIQSTPEMDLIDTARDYDGAKRALAKPDYDVALLDLDLNGVSSINLIQQRDDPAAQSIIVVSVLGDEATVISAIEAGADGYILKDEAFSRLADAIMRVKTGEAPLSPAIARHLLRRFRESATQGAESPDECELTRRERQVLEALARGCSYKDVAREYGISRYTVGDYTKSLYKKLRVNSRSAAVSKALRSGIIRVAGR